MFLYLYLSRCFSFMYGFVVISRCSTIITAIAYVLISYVIKHSHMPDCSWVSVWAESRCAHPVTECAMSEHV